MKKYYLILLSLLSGIFFSLAWPVGGFPGLLFIALAPMIFIEDHILNNNQNFHRFSVFTYTFPGFAVWNALTTYWIYNSTPFGGIAAVLFNAFLMAIVFQIWHWIRKYIKSPHSLFTLIFIWIGFEYLHHNWDLNWPWMSLGNGFATYYKWVQWYEYTGVFGGTFWILIVNLFIFLAINGILNKKQKSFYKNFT